MTKDANTDSGVVNHTESRHCDVFINEIGNTISIEVAGINGRVCIVIRGPSSISENIVTRQEAEKLRHLLNGFLGPTTLKTVHDYWCDLNVGGLECNCTYGEPL